MVVVAILAILIAIALPTFLGARAPAQDKQAETILRTSLIAAHVGETDTGDYTWVTPSALSLLESSVVFVDAATPANASARQVSVGTGVGPAGTYVVMVSRSAAGRCFALLEQTADTTHYLADVVPACQASAFDMSSAWSPTPW